MSVGLSGWRPLQGISALINILSASSVLAPFTSTHSVDTRHAQDRDHDLEQVALLSPASSSMSSSSLSDKSHSRTHEPEKPWTHAHTTSMWISPSTMIASVSQLSWLDLYFLANPSLTLYNKFVLVRFPFPHTLTALHALCGAIGGYVLMERDVFELRSLSTAEDTVLVAFSALYTVDIAVSNLSLGLVTVPVRGSVSAASMIYSTYGRVLEAPEISSD